MKVFAYLRNPGYCENLVERDYKKIDVINFAFGKIIDGKLNVDHLSNLNKVLELKSKGLKVVIVIDGVEKSTREAFILACKNQENRKQLANSIIELINKYNFDGVDLDWEAPFGEEQINNYTLLIKTIREYLDNVNKELLLTAAVYSSGFNEHYNLNEMSKYLNYLHIMTYGMGSKKYASHNSPFLPSADTKVSITTAVKDAFDNGFKNNQVIIGIPFYARGGVIGKVSKVIGTEYQEGTFRAISNTKFLEEFSDKPTLFDEDCHAYYKYDGETFMTFDNEYSIKEKAEFVKEKSLGGMMFWDYGHDKENGFLLEYIDKYLKNE